MSPTKLQTRDPAVPPTRRPLTRRRVVALGVTLLVAPRLASPVAASHNDGDDDDYRPGRTGGCVRYFDYEDEIEEEEERFCAGPEGAYYELEEDGDEERYDWDAAGTLRRYREEEADGDEVEYWYDGNGVLRYYRREDDDDDLYEVQYDAAGRRRWAHREDGDDNEDTYWWWDEEGNLVDFWDDD